MASLTTACLEDVGSVGLVRLSAFHAPALLHAVTTVAALRVTVHLPNNNPLQLVAFVEDPRLLHKPFSIEHLQLSGRHPLL